METEKKDVQKLLIKATERRHCNLKHISHLFLMFLSLTLNKQNFCLNLGVLIVSSILWYHGQSQTLAISNVKFLKYRYFFVVPIDMDNTTYEIRI